MKFHTNFNDCNACRIDSPAHYYKGIGSEDGETLNKIEHIFVDNLICVIDEAVEKCENYQERISQEYSITTESEKWERSGIFWAIPKGPTILEQY